jgi:hypothetical protein
VLSVRELGIFKIMSALPKSASSPQSRGPKDQEKLSALRQKRAAAKRPPKEKQEVKSKVAAIAKDHPLTLLWESSAILGVNVLLLGTAIVTLVNLIPNQMTQQAKLQELRAEESSISKNLQQLKQDYERNQTPEMAQRIAQEQGNLLRANQKQVILITPTQKVQ